MGNQLDKKYQQLLSDIIAFGVEKKDRTGTGTISEFGHQIRHKMDGICCNLPDDFELIGYQSHSSIKAPLSN